MKNHHWDQSSIHAYSKKVHSQPIISISQHDLNLFFTSSEDNTLRLWDLRLHSSVKLFRSPGLHTFSNCQSDHTYNLFVGAGPLLHSFDIRNEGILIEQTKGSSQQAHFDDISFIKVNQGRIGVGDDQGDVRLYNFQLECTELLDQGHNNIVNSLEFVNTENGKLCISGGFDCRLVHWKVEKEQIVREIDMQKLFNKHEINASSMPFIYSVHLHKTTLFVSTQTGHVLAFPVKDLKKHKYILQASLARVVQAKVPEFNQNLLLTLSREGSFSLFDHTKRYNGAPLFLQKYKCKQEPNWVQFMQNEIIVSNSLDAELSFFAVKG